VHVFGNTILAKSDTNVGGELIHQYEDLSRSSLFHSIRKFSSFLFPLPFPSDLMHTFAAMVYFFVPFPLQLRPIPSPGFGAQGINQLFENNYVVNGDDCITIKNGSANITFR
jgi:hypothetical protein